MSGLLTNIGTVFTSAIGWVTTVANTIAGTTTTGTGSEAVTTLNNPVLFLFCVAVPLCGLGVGMFKRLLSTRG